MIRFDGFYITVNQYLVVDTPVFDEITDGIQILQFIPRENQKDGEVVIAEFGALLQHPKELNIKELREQIQKHRKKFSKLEDREFWHKIGDSGKYPIWLDMVEKEFFNKRKEPEKFPRIYSGRYSKGEANKITIYTNADDSKFEFEHADGTIMDEKKLSLTYHYGNKDTISIFKYVEFW